MTQQDILPGTSVSSKGLMCHLEKRFAIGEDETYLKLFGYDPHPDSHGLRVQEMPERKHLSLIKCFTQDVRLAFSARPSN